MSWYSRNFIRHLRIGPSPKDAVPARPSEALRFCRVVRRRFCWRQPWVKIHKSQLEIILNMESDWKNCMFLWEMCHISMLQCVAVCCSVLQCVAVCCSVLHQLTSPTYAPHQQIAKTRRSIYVYRCVYIHICICIYIYIHAYKYMYIYIDICTYWCLHT